MKNERRLQSGVFSHFLLFFFEHYIAGPRIIRGPAIYLRVLNFVLFRRCRSRSWSWCVASAVINRRLRVTAAVVDRWGICTTVINRWCLSTRRIIWIFVIIRCLLVLLVFLLFVFILVFILLRLLDYMSRTALCRCCAFGKIFCQRRTGRSC